MVTITIMAVFINNDRDKILLIMNLDKLLNNLSVLFCEEIILSEGLEVA